MQGKKVIVGGLAVLLVVMLPVGPINFAYVYSGSMAPSIPADSGVILTPGTIHEGDIITYQSPEHDAYVTHRVVEERSDGFVTQGDANPSTDQSTGSPLVARSQVVGKVLTIGGAPVTIPGIGLLARIVQERPLLTAVITVLIGLVSTLLSRWREHRIPNKPRTPLTAGEIYHTVFVIALVTTVGLGYFGADTQTVEPPTGDAPSIDAAENATETIALNVSAAGSGRFAAHADNAVVRNQTVNGSTLSVTLDTPPSTNRESVPATLRVYHYPAILPTWLATPLERVHPLAAVTATALAVFLPLYLLTLVTVDRKRPVTPSRSRRLRALKERVTVS